MSLLSVAAHSLTNLNERPGARAALQHGRIQARADLHARLRERSSSRLLMIAVVAWRYSRQGWVITFFVLFVSAKYLHCIYSTARSPYL